MLILLSEVITIVAFVIIQLREGDFMALIRWGGLVRVAEHNCEPPLERINPSKILIADHVRHRTAGSVDRRPASPRGPERRQADTAQRRRRSVGRGGVRCLAV